VRVTQGVVKFIDGELDEARGICESAVEIAPPGSPPLFRALANLATIEFSDADEKAWRRRHDAALDAALRAGDRPNILWLQSQQILRSLDFGEWDEALRLIDTLGHEATYQDGSVDLHRAIILASRGDIDTARSLRDGALGRIADSTEDQAVIPTLLWSAWISLIAGDDDLMRTLVADAWPVVEHSRYRAPGVGATETAVVMRSGLTEEWRRRHEANAPTARVEAALLMLRGNAVEAADAWAPISPYDEAVARIEAARVLVGQGRRSEADIQLQRGLAFFRAVGARRVIEQAELLLAAVS
jgi:hypothetical protein